MADQRTELANEQLNQLLDTTELAELRIDLSAETIDALRAATGEESSFEDTLRLALLYGTAITALEVRLAQAASGTPTVGEELLRELQGLESLYAAMRFQTYKLRHGVLLEETRVAGTVGQNETFETLIGRLRERLSATGS